MIRKLLTQERAPEGTGQEEPLDHSLLPVPLSSPGLLDLVAPDLDLPLAVAEEDGRADNAHQTDWNKEEQEAAEAGGGARDLDLTCHLS